MRNMSKGKKLMVLGAAAPLMILLVIGIGGGVVMLLWNWLMPALFAGPQVTFWQAFGLLALCRILFGGRGLQSHAGSNMRRRMAERWGVMTPEERERFRQRMRERCGFGPASDEGASTSTGS